MWEGSPGPCFSASLFWIWSRISLFVKQALSSHSLARSLKWILQSSGKCPNTAFKALHDLPPTSVSNMSPSRHSPFTFPTRSYLWPFLSLSLYTSFYLELSFPPLFLQTGSFSFLQEAFFDTSSSPLPPDWFSTLLHLSSVIAFITPTSNLRLLIPFYQKGTVTKEVNFALLEQPRSNHLKIVWGGLGWGVLELEWDASSPTTLYYKGDYIYFMWDC